jgi:hypothetical protein
MVDTFGEASTLIGICKKDGSVINFNAIIETVDISGGEKGVDSTATTRGGRLKMFKPEEDSEITLEGYAVEVGSESTTGNGFYDLMGTLDTSQPLSISSDHSFNEYQLTICATDDTTLTSATGQTAADKSAMRWNYKNGHFTKLDASFTDGVWKFTLTFKVTPFNKTGTANCTYESTDGDAQLDAISAYT